ncbi:MAG: DUF3592 domain-containing protein [Euryarchaeota archaeon]|jgi:hypothetical protein|nr:DUF3592 domain-containing protein [Euryarchaeota archaeon]MBT6640258.1 DUF3592 domain-containing protein [Euryarchaeota archaeon]
MVEVECPLCSETVDLGSDSTGTYECPYCEGDFEYESSTSLALNDTNLKRGLLKQMNNPRETSQRLTQKKLEKIVLPIFMVIFTVAFLVLVFVYMGVSGWEETEGEIISSYSTDSELTEYQYTFKVDGETFNGSDECHSRGGGGDEQNCESYDIGDAVMISYNPGNPNENEMVDNQLPSIFLCFFSLPVILLGLALYSKFRDSSNFEGAHVQIDSDKL